MISSIRSGIHKAGYKYIVWTLLIIFAFSGTGLFVGFFTKDQGGSIASVNGYPITPGEWRSKIIMVDQRIKSIQQQFGQHANYFLQILGLTENPEDIAFKELVREKLLLEVADTMHLTHLSSDYITQKLSNPTFVMQNLSMLVPPFLYDATGRIDPLALKNYLRHQGISHADFEEQIELALKQFFILSLLPSMSFISKHSIDQALVQEHGTRSFSTVTVDLDDYVVKLQKKSPAEQELKEYFDRHNAMNKRYWSEETRKGSGWKFEPISYGVTVSDADIKHYYEQNKKAYGEKKLADVRKEIEKKLVHEKFAHRFANDARRVIAQNDETALEEFVKKHGGKNILNVNEKFNPNSLPITKLFSLKTGQAGTVLGNNEGYIVKLQEIHERKVRPFQDVAKEVERDYIQEKSAQNLSQDVAELMENISTAVLEKFAKEHQLSIKKIRIADAQWAEAEKEGLPVDRMKKMMHPGYGLTQSTKDGIKIVLLEAFEARNALDASADQKIVSERLAIEKNMKQQEMQVISAAFIASLQNNATIESKNIHR